MGKMGKMGKMSERIRTIDCPLSKKRVFRGAKIVNRKWQTYVPMRLPRSSVKLIIFLVCDGFKPFVGGILSVDLDSEVGEP